MNRVDKELYKALKFFATYTREEINNMEDHLDDDALETKARYKESIDDIIKRTLVQFDYILPNGKTKWVITQSGLQQLRDLEQILHRDKIILWSVLAVIIYLLAFFKSVG